MTTREQKIKSICPECYKKMPDQILFYFIREEIEDVLLNKDEPITRDDIESAIPKES